MNDKAWLTPLTGLAFFVLAIVGFVAFGEPPGADVPDEVVDFYVDNEGSQFASAIVEAIAGTLFVFFGGVLRREIRAAEGERGLLGDVAFAGMVIFALGLALDATITFTLAESAADIDPAAVQALIALWHNDFVPFAMGLQIFLLATGFAIVRHRVLPKWLGWIAILLGVVALSPIGFAAFIGSGILVAIISVTLAMRTKAAHPRPAAPAAPSDGLMS